MALGLAALLDDIAALAKLTTSSLDDIAAGAAKAGSKAVAVVVDDTAVTPQYVAGVAPSRELPIIGRIARGSLINKAIILVGALLLSQFAPWVLTPLLMLGGTYLCFEGAHKIWGKILGHAEDTPAVEQGGDAENRIVSNAVRTDFILSAEIMVIALNEVATEPLLVRAGIMVLVAILITALVYGVVALIVKLDDIGFHLAAKPREASQRTGRALVRAMPKILSTLTVIGTIAMLWVGGHLLIAGSDELGWGLPHHLVATLTAPIANSAIAWIVETACSAIAGLACGSLCVGSIAAVSALRAAQHGDAASE